MTKEQYRRANKVVFPVMVLILGYLLLAMGLLVLTKPETAGWYTYVEMAASLVGLIAVIVVFLSKKDTKICGICMMTAGAFVYVVFRLVGVSEGTSIYAYPILIASMIYLNRRLVIWGNSAIVAGNIVRVIMHLDKLGGPDGETVILNLLVSFLVAYASIRITALLVRFNEENTGVITEAAKKQEAGNAIMVTVADNIIKHFDEAMERFNTLSESLKNSHTSMENIAGSTESTAEAIQEEAAICGEILAQTDAAGEATESMIAASKRVNTTVDSGAFSVQELGRQADNVSNSSKVVEEVITVLTSKVQQVSSFVDTILSISSQTNLLALNASIEAARAGEAGRGFSVVAEEIRLLSEDTKEASNNITNIIQELNTDTKLANESIETAVSSVARQNELIQQTKEKFDEVSKEVELLSNNIDEVKECMEQTRKLSNSIYDNISQLSAASEEVAASSSEGLDNSNITVEQVDTCKGIFESIYELAKDLKNQ
ncbi:MAG: chemotaxis protein [Lachnospiraceae bacterium]|nr:chemotaxis protein [Lachnospiraceae bacterium]